ncbi:ABC transporter ATP-binding protein [Clostridium polynesiense]|uniref:ABC transporter ATP-binding protein n=1 Tax=Clostridium polynesiense TaxID=1325933 RepID=UPI00058F7D46|nr:energy-coupling factor ABC transporter ATP-binding protein [Clostridium polynesiense]
MRVTIDSLIKKYNEKTVLNIDNLTIEEGKIYGILGLNGSGKSTLIQCISGLIPFDYGKIFYNGQEDIHPVRKSISASLQGNNLFNRTVFENIICGLEYRKASKELIKERTDKYLRYFNLQSFLNKNAKTLSGGEGAKVALLRTAVLETELTFLDEPTASMDIESTFQAEELIRYMAQGKKTVVVVTHDILQAKRISDEVIFMDKGRILEMGLGKKVLNNPESDYLKKVFNL